MHVLLIDDDPFVRRLGAAGLRAAAGVEVVCAISGANGVALAQVSRPDVVLLDLNMPGEDGPTTFARLRATPGLSDVPVVFFTAETSAEVRDMLVELGAAGVIAKPFDPVSLAREVREVLARYRAAGSGAGA